MMRRPPRSTRTDTLMPYTTRVRTYEGSALVRVQGAPGEVGRAAARGPVPAADGLRRALADEVDLCGGVDRHEAVVAGDHPGVVHPADRQHLDRRVLVQEVVETLGAQAEGGDDLSGAHPLVRPGYPAELHQVDEAVGEQTAVDVIGG